MKKEEQKWFQIKPITGGVINNGTPHKTWKRFWASYGK